MASFSSHVTGDGITLPAPLTGRREHNSLSLACNETPSARRFFSRTPITILPALIIQFEHLEYFPVKSSTYCADHLQQCLEPVYFSGLFFSSTNCGGVASVRAFSCFPNETNEFVKLNSTIIGSCHGNIYFRRNSSRKTAVLKERVCCGQEHYSSSFHKNIQKYRA